MSSVICKGKYTSNIGYFLRAVEYGGEKIHTQKIHFKDGRIEDVKDDMKIDFSKYDVSEIEKVSFILKDSEKQISMSVEKYQEKITQTKSPIKSIDVLESEDVDEKNYPEDCKTDVEFLGYIDYTANRLGVEKEGGTGLFGIGGNISMDMSAEIANEAYKNGVRIFWMNIISISKEDGNRLGFNNRQAWKDLIISKAPDIAKAYNIPIENFRMYVGFHTNHPNNYHVHLNFHSMLPSDGYIKNGAKGGFTKASEKIKSIIVNSIFKDDVAEIKKLINIQKKDISQILTTAMTNIAVSDKLNNSFLSLVEDLKENDKGKAEYGYLKANSKKMVANVLRDITENDIDIKTLTSEYFKSCEQQVRVYIDDDEKVQVRMTNIKERFFNPDYHHNDSTTLHNIIVKFAKGYINGEIPGEPQATKKKIELYALPEEKASDNFAQYEEIPDISDECTPLKEMEDPYSSQNSYQKHHLANFKEFQKSICKEVKDMLFNSINNNDAAASLFFEISDELKAEKNNTSYENITAKIQALTSKLAEENSDLKKLLNSFKLKMISEAHERVPKDIVESYKENVEKSFSNGSLVFSFNAMLFQMAADKNRTYANAGAKLLTKEHKELRKRFSKKIYNTMQLPKDKLKQNKLYAIIKKMGTPSLEKDEKELLARQAVICMFKEDKKLSKAVDYLESIFVNGPNNIDADKKHQLFNDVFLFDSYSGVTSTVLYIADNQDTIMKKIQATKKKIIINSMCRAVAQVIYANTKENQNKLSHTSEENNKLSKTRGSFSNIRGSLSADVTFNNL